VDLADRVLDVDFSFDVLFLLALGVGDSLEIGVETQVGVGQVLFGRFGVFDRGRHDLVVTLGPSVLAEREEQDDEAHDHDVNGAPDRPGGDLSFEEALARILFRDYQASNDRRRGGLRRPAVLRGDAGLHVLGHDQLLYAADTDDVTALGHRPGLFT